ncbi:head-tail adaptor Ad1 [Arthrobacter phage Hestia]|uniref:Head-to-tail adaptor n=1 Tax=Arthrobacter phage Hestia TaxID=2419609 RepID=A0A3G3M3B2_9CAUD|nr:head-tail adaptor Ad1 [Arthrobacter phage Hestia]AYR00890.1 head-to-tail adaptor [Arthrobacter phage Hestia]
MTVAVLPEDVAAGWRPLSDAEAVVAESQIGEALVLLGAKVRDLAAKDEDLVALVVKKMVRRYLKNPEGYRIDPSSSIDDYTEGGGTRDSSVSTGELYVSAEELSLLGVRTGGAFEVRLG